MIFIIVGIGVLYLLLISGFIVGFDRIPTFERKDLKPKTRFSILIPFRNEAQALPALLDSLSKLNYPKTQFEIIFINDDSKDHSVQTITSFLTSLPSKAYPFSVIDTARISSSPKKDAITLGVSRAKYEWIITTDADCILPKYWLESFDAYIQSHNPNMIVAPLTYLRPHGFLQNFQLLDVLSLQGSTIGSFGINEPFLCNAANLAYKKELFKTLQGFQGNSNIASGDDIFLLEKALKYQACKVHYLKCHDAVVFTMAVKSWPNLVEQRVRWAAKSGAYKNWFGQVAGLIVFSQNALLVCCILLIPTNFIVTWIVLVSFLLKLIFDFLLIYKAANFFHQKSHLSYYPFSAISYPFFSVYIVFLSVFKGFEWKNRSYRK